MIHSYSNPVKSRIYLISSSRVHQPGISRPGMKRAGAQLDMLDPMGGTAMKVTTVSEFHAFQQFRERYGDSLNGVITIHAI